MLIFLREVVAFLDIIAIIGEVESSLGGRCTIIASSCSIIGGICAIVGESCVVIGKSGAIVDGGTDALRG